MLFDIYLSFSLSCEAEVTALTLLFLPSSIPCKTCYDSSTIYFNWLGRCKARIGPTFSNRDNLLFLLYFL